MTPTSDHTKTLKVVLGGPMRRCQERVLDAAEIIEAGFAGGEKRPVSGSCLEFAERGVLSRFASLAESQIRRERWRESLETGNADKIFESTYSSQAVRRSSSVTRETLGCFAPRDN